jgi:phosphoribosylformylglycinamidine synthase
VAAADASTCAPSPATTRHVAAGIWCNESQERYVLAVTGASCRASWQICARERCPVAVVGEATAEPRLLVSMTASSATRRWTCPWTLLFGKPPRMPASIAGIAAAEPLPRIASLAEALRACWQLPAVGSKSF